MISPTRDVEARVYLHPGQLAVAGEGHTLTTILGSCVAVCLHDVFQRIGGLNHFLLPSAPPGGDSTRYGDIATRKLLLEMERRGSAIRHLQAKVIGGACVLEANQDRGADLGRANARAALDLLADAGIPVVLQDIGGQRGRRVLFRPGTGDVVVRQL